MASSRKADSCRGAARLLTCLLLLLAAVPARAQDDAITLAFYAPSVYFTDSIARAGFIDSIAAHVQEETGVSVRGVNISSAADLDSAQFAIVDGLYFSGSQRGEPLGAARVDGDTAAPLALLVSTSGPTRLSDLRGGTLILPRAGDELADFISAQVLHGEMPAADFFGTIDYTSNIESALSAVAQGRADATLGYASYADRAGLRVLGSYGDGPLPVFVQLDPDVPAAVAQQIATALRSGPGGESLEGFTGYDADAVSGFRDRTGQGRAPRQPVMTPTRAVTVEPGGIDLPDAREPLVAGDPSDLIVLPAMEEP